MPINKLNSGTTTFKRVQKPFTIVSNQIFTDFTITDKALRIYCYLLSKPETWIVHNKELLNTFKIGIDGLATVMRCLKKQGYISRLRNRKENGQFEYITYVHYEPLPLDSFEIVNNMTKFNKNSIYYDTEAENMGSNHTGLNPAMVNTSIGQVPLYSNKENKKERNKEINSISSSSKETKIENDIAFNKPTPNTYEARLEMITQYCENAMIDWNEVKNNFTENQLKLFIHENIEFNKRLLPSTLLSYMLKNQPKQYKPKINTDLNQDPALAKTDTKLNTKQKSKEKSITSTDNLSMENKLQELKDKANELGYDYENIVKTLGMPQLKLEIENCDNYYQVNLKRGKKWVYRPSTVLKWITRQMEWKSQNDNDKLVNKKYKANKNILPIDVTKIAVVATPTDFDV